MSEICRICFDGEGGDEGEGGDLLRDLCLCRGSMRCIHSHCLKASVKHRCESHNDPRKVISCETCLMMYPTHTLENLLRELGWEYLQNAKGLELATQLSALQRVAYHATLYTESADFGCTRAHARARTCACSRAHACQCHL